jgi:hypothetical protein
MDYSYYCLGADCPSVTRGTHCSLGSQVCMVESCARLYYRGRE